MNTYNLLPVHTHCLSYTKMGYLITKKLKNTYLILSQKYAKYLLKKTLYQKLTETLENIFFKKNCEILDFTF